MRIVFNFNSQLTFHRLSEWAAHFAIISSSWAKVLLMAVIIVTAAFVRLTIARGDETHIVRLIKADIIKHAGLFSPANIFVDRERGEIYVGRGNRLFIFNKRGVLLSEIYLGEGFAASKVAVSKKGTIYVLHSNDLTISKFDQFGKKLGLFEVRDFRGKGGPREMAVTSVAIDQEDNLYLLDASSNSCLITGTDGVIKSIVGEGKLEGYTDVDVSPDGQTLAFINFRKGKIRLYNGSGDMLIEFGELAGAPGTFSQPVAISLAPDGAIFVLDRNRQGILIFDQAGQFSSEFGGLGTGAGLFNYPNDVFIDTDYNIFVADTANNRLQLLRVELIKKNS